MTFSLWLFRGSRLFLSIVAIFSLSTNMTSAKTGPSHNKVVVCYISKWAVYRPGLGAYSTDKFDPHLCTHAVYALDITQSDMKSLDPCQGLKDEKGKDRYERLTGLKKTHPHLKVSLAIGGWNEGSKNYSTLAADPFQRHRFVKQVSRCIRKYDFDGLNLDWVYPTQRGGVAKDRENFVLLTKELREEFDKYNLLLTSAIGAAKGVIDEAYDVRQLSRYLDFLHIMCYDYHGSWDKKVGFNSPLTSAAGDVLSVQYTIEYLLSMGAPPNKIVLGLPFYGRNFNSPFEGKINDPAEGTGFQGPFTREDGFLGYNEICAILSNKTSGWTSSWDAYTSQAVAHSQRDDTTGLVRVVTFDSSRSIANKVMYAMRKSLAGVMIWSIDTDDFMGECEPADDTFLDFKLLMGKDGNVMVPKRLNSKYPLMRTINEATIYALEQINMEEQERAQDKYNEIPHGTQSDRKNSSNKASNVFISSTSFIVANIVLYLFAQNASSNFSLHGIRILFTIYSIVSLIVMVSAKTGPKHDKVVFCYLYPNDFVQSFEPDLCTHVVSSYHGFGFSKENFKEDKNYLLTEVKRRYPHLKVGIAIGGDQVKYDEFSTFVSDSGKRKKFVVETTNFLRTNGIEYLDITWLQRNKDELQPKDRANFVSLFKELREEFDKYGDLLLATGINKRKPSTDSGLTIKEISKYVDYLIVLAFNYHGFWESKVGFNAPLRSNDELNVQFTIDSLLRLGLPTSKLVLVISFIGTAFQTSNNGGIGDKADSGFQGSNGIFGSAYIPYNEICKTATRKNNWTLTYNSEADEVLAILHRDYNDGATRVVTFDNSRSVASKVMFAMQKSLAGFMAWPVNSDDDLGDCKLEGDTFFDFKRYNEYSIHSNDLTYPLLRTINDATMYTLEEIESVKKQKEEQVLKEQFIQLQLKLRQEEEKKQEFENKLKKQKEQQIKQQMEEELKLNKEWEMRGQKLQEELYMRWQKQQEELYIRWEKQQLEQEQEKKEEFENELKKLKEQQMKQIEEIEKKLKLKEEQEMREQKLQQQLKMQADQLLKQEMEQQALKNAQQNIQKQLLERSKEQKKSSTKEMNHRICVLSKKIRCLDTDLLAMANSR